jgi:hypothetical protein
MSSKSKLEKEKEAAAQEKLQIILGRMLQDEENKYCADCDSKGEVDVSNLGSVEFQAFQVTIAVVLQPYHTLKG